MDFATDKGMEAAAAAGAPVKREYEKPLSGISTLFRAFGIV